MEKKYLLPQLIILLIFVVLPPLFVNSLGENARMSFVLTPALLIQLIIAVALHVEHIYISRKKKAQNNETSSQKDIQAQKLKTTVSNLKWFSLTLGAIMIIYALMIFLAWKFPDFFSSIQPQVERPRKAAWISAILNIIISAFFEEAIYREFLPNALHTLVSTKKKWLYLLLEALVIVIFALGHRYAGILAVVNALLCAVMLRLCYIKTNSLYAGAAAHTLYNLTILLFTVLA